MTLAPSGLLWMPHPSLCLARTRARRRLQTQRDVAVASPASCRHALCEQRHLQRLVVFQLRPLAPWLFRQRSQFRRRSLIGRHVRLLMTPWWRPMARNPLRHVRTRRLVGFQLAARALLLVARNLRSHLCWSRRVLTHRLVGLQMAARTTLWEARGRRPHPRRSRRIRTHRQVAVREAARGTRWAGRNP